jgi:hypothetical protein
MGEKAKDLIDKERFSSRVKKVNDIQICLYIDEWLSDNKSGASYVTLTRSEKMNLAKLLLTTFRKRGFSGRERSLPFRGGAGLLALERSFCPERGCVWSAKQKAAE